MSRNILILAASKVLYKFSEGEEDWSEWDDLAIALEGEIELGDLALPDTVTSRVAEFRERQRNLLASLPAERDNCEICLGRNGGVPGNENIIDGVVQCDYCAADTLRQKNAT